VNCDWLLCLGYECPPKWWWVDCFIPGGGSITERWMAHEASDLNCGLTHCWIYDLIALLTRDEVFLIPACIKEVGYWRHFLGCCLLSQAPLCLILFFLKTMRWTFLVHQPFCNDVLPDHRTETMVPAIYGP
jgi:hypothetical protein